MGSPFKNHRRPFWKKSESSSGMQGVHRNQTELYRGYDPKKKPTKDQDSKGVEVSSKPIQGSINGIQNNRISTKGSLSLSFTMPPEQLVAYTSLHLPTPHEDLENHSGSKCGLHCSSDSRRPEAEPNPWRPQTPQTCSESGHRDQPEGKVSHHWCVYLCFPKMEVYFKIVKSCE